jgi:hypothetical protein
MEPKVHLFETEREAYDASQCDERISDGDVLLAVEASSAAILIRAWPTLVEIGERGAKPTEFDRLKKEIHWENVEGGRYLASLVVAREALLARGWA